MTAETMNAVPADAAIHPAWVRVCHWINALAIVVMIGSGWQIYNASPLFPFEFSKHYALGNWLGGALLWHFAAMWVLVVNGIVYVTLGLLPGASAANCCRSIRPKSSPTSRRRLHSNSRMRICRTTTRCKSCFTPASSSAAF